MHTTTERSTTIRTATLLLGKEFSDCKSFSGYTNLPVLELRDEFSLADYHFGGAAAMRH